MTKTEIDNGHVRWFFVDIEESDGWRAAWKLNFLVDKHDGRHRGFVGYYHSEEGQKVLPANWTVGFQ